MDSLDRTITALRSYKSGRERTFARQGTYLVLGEREDLDAARRILEGAGRCKISLTPAYALGEFIAYEITYLDTN